ncbi:hypothetical protein RHMOL_Rhmol03G0031500 [Rhododendron molle]|uniref:Uncharacterized protein n=2 Tax=Rhododendron molle TaxID=49168 RepID=A0ACC0PCC6_RHOML|nr:hypothetical protein RHMOL_Rhmol03G0031500 [Rhododendron molle]KAI8562377.1 hypothetical protein RHMOL_Rhmol03G0031500 [Rhododendron molle]
MSTGMLSRHGDPYALIISRMEYQIGHNGNLQGVGLFINMEPKTRHLESEPRDHCLRNAAVDMENTVPEMEDQGVESYILDLLKIWGEFGYVVQCLFVLLKLLALVCCGGAQLVLTSFGVVQQAILVAFLLEFWGDLCYLF